MTMIIKSQLDTKGGEPPLTSAQNTTMEKNDNFTQQADFVVRP